MNTILGYVKNDGIYYENTIDNRIDNVNIDFDYIQISLICDKMKDVIVQNGNIMLVSKCDINLIMNFKWYLGSSGYPCTYGTYDGSIKFGNCPVSLHQLIFGKLEKGYVIDHINRNKLDNRRDNLRVCTSLQNSYNKSRPKNSKNKYKGVKKIIPKNNKNNSKYIATITKDGVRHEIRNIQTEEEAAKIYDMMAEELFGQYAGLNF
jgi:hypothetical protein